MKPNIKIYVLIAVFYLLFIGLLVLITLFNLISMLAFIISMLIVIVVPLAVGMLIYFIRKAKTTKLEEKDLFKRKRILDSDTAVAWAKDYMKENYITDIKIVNKSVFQFGDLNERTTIIHLNIKGSTDDKYYDILVNAFDKSLHTIIQGVNDFTYISKLAEHLAFAPVYRPKRITKKIQPEGVETTVEEELMPANVKEEVTEHENK